MLSCYLLSICTALRFVIALKNQHDDDQLKYDEKEQESLDRTEKEQVLRD